MRYARGSVQQRENRAVEKSLLSGAQCSLFSSFRRTTRARFLRESDRAFTVTSILSMSIYSARLFSAASTVPIATIGDLMDCDTKWRQYVSPFSCLHRSIVNLRHALRPAPRKKQTAHSSTTMHNGIQPVCF